MKYDVEQIMKEEIDRCKMHSRGPDGTIHLVEHPVYGILAHKVFFSTPKKVWKQAIENLKMILEAKYYVVIKERKE